MKTISPSEISIMECQLLMQSLVIPRPIALASTIDKDGKINLSPFSFFNMFSANPPILIFSPARRARDGSVKHTLENAYEVPEVVINIVNFNMVEQTSLSSVEYDKGTNEFIKSGLTALPSQKIKPPRVAESPASFECKINQIIPLGDKAGAGNLIICEVLLIHFNESILDESGKKADPYLLEAVARLGGDYYAKINDKAIFELPKPNQKKGIGIDQIPEKIRNSKILSGNNLGRLGNVEKLPDENEIKDFKSNSLIWQSFNKISHHDQESVHTFCKKLIEKGKVMEAWIILLNE